MDKQTIVAIVLGVVALGVVGTQLMPALGGSGTPAVAPSTASTNAGATLAILDARKATSGDQAGNAYAQLIARVVADDLAFATNTIRNPFRPLVGPGSMAFESQDLEDARRLVTELVSTGSHSGVNPLTLGYSVNGIIWTGQGPLVLLNDQVLGVGEDIEEGGRIAAITADAVIFTYEGQSVTLPIGEDEW